MRHVTERLDSLQGEQSNAQKITETALIIHHPKKENSKDFTLGKKDSDNEPPAKKFKVLIPTSEIPSPTPLSANILEHLLNLVFPPSPPKEPTPPKDPSKGKGISIEEPMKELIPYIEGGGSDLKKLNIKPFVTTEEESEKSLRKIMNPATVKAQTLNLAEYEEKRQKMLDEYNNCIYDRVDPLPITKIHYKVNSSQDATMKITRDHDPLNVKAKKLGTPPLPELAHFGKPTVDKKRKRSEVLTEVFVKENITVDGMKRNLIPPPGVEGRKGLVIKESEEGIFYYNGNFDLAFQRVLEFHLATIVQLVRLQDSIIRDSPEAEEVYKLLGLEIESRNDVTKAKEIVKDNLDGMGQHVLKGLSECKASEGNFRRIQVKDIVKEVEDYLKTYSSAGMDISWWKTLISCHGWTKGYLR
ncbi:hypothetical protein Tco_0283054 [Tanacetum coccineum]